MLCTSVKITWPTLAQKLSKPLCMDAKVGHQQHEVLKDQEKTNSDQQ